MFGLLLIDWGGFVCGFVCLFWVLFGLDVCVGGFCLIVVILFCGSLLVW